MGYAWPTSYLSSFLGWVWEKESARRFIFELDHRAFLFHNAAISRGVRHEGHGVAATVQEFSTENWNGHYLILKTGYVEQVNFDTLNAYVGGQMNAQINPLDGLFSSSAATSHGSARWGSRSCWMTEHDSNARLSTIACAPANYGLQLCRSVGEMGNYINGYRFSNEWQPVYHLLLNAAAGRFCRQNIGTVDGHNPTRGGVFNNFGGGNVCFTCL